MNRFRKPFLNLLLFFAGTIPSFAFEAQVDQVLPRDYCGTLLREIENSTSSIVAAIYLFSLNLQDPNSPTLKIAQALADAHKRGVRVEVLLDQNIDFVNLANKSTWAVDGKNWAAYEYLTQAGIVVTFDSSSSYTHSKIVVFDKKTILLGSSNWSSTSFFQNQETNVLIHSPQLAQEFLNTLAAIERQLPQENKNVTLVPVRFLENSSLLGSLVTTSDHTGFDLYLYLLKKSQEIGGADFELENKDLANTLGIYGLDRLSLKTKITKVLKRLSEKYQLLTIEKKYNKNLKIHLNLEEGESLEIPNDYWELGWNKKLPLPGKVFYLLSLYYASNSSMKPQWSKSGESLAQKHHVSLWFIHQGVTTLRRANLLEVQYDKLSKDGSEPRRPNIYSLNPLYDPKQLETALKDLEKKVGREKFDRALKNAELVYADNQLNAIKRFIELEDAYGIEKIQAAYKIIEQREPSNPKRSVGYFINTIISLAEDVPTDKGRPFKTQE